MSSSGFAARAQSAGDRNANQAAAASGSERGHENSAAGGVGRGNGGKGN